MSNRTINLTPEVYTYLCQVSLRESPVLKQLRDETAKLPGAVMQIAPEQGQFMAFLLHLLGARKTIDVGTFTGYSALVAAQALPADGKVIACDVSAETSAIAERFWEQAGVAHKVDLRLAPALETLMALNNTEAGTFDFIFIDADKANYDAYYEQALTLLRRGGVIAVDNVLWGGEVANPHNTETSTQVIRALNQKIHHDDRVEISLVPIADGLTLVRKL